MPYCGFRFGTSVLEASFLAWYNGACPKKSDMPYCGFRFWNFRSRSMMCSMEVYQELKDNILQFKFPARVGVQRLGAASIDLTDFAGQKRDLRTMEPVAGEIGHCFVVGAGPGNLKCTIWSYT